VEAKDAHAVGELLVGRGDQTAVAETKEILRGVEAVRRRDAGRRRSGRAERLRGVLDDRDPERRQFRQRRRAPEQVDRHDRARPGRDSRRDVLGVEIQRRAVDFREDGCRASPSDRLGGGVESERRADHLVAGADSHRIEDENDRIGAVRHADRYRYAEISCGLLLEGSDVRPEDEDARLEHVVHGAPQLGKQGRVLRLDVNERDLRHVAKL
jgi:hypothetical protein